MASTMDFEVNSERLWTNCDLDSCANCCEPLDPLNNTNDDDIINASTALTSLYRLDILDVFLDDFSLEVNPPFRLCAKCVPVLTNLYTLYEEFNQLRHLNSRLAQHIRKLDECTNTKDQDLPRTIVKTEPEVEFHPMKEPSEPEGISHSNLNSNSTPSPGPWVVLKRLENDPAAQKYVSKSFKKSAARNKTRKRKKPIREPQTKMEIEEEEKEKDTKFTTEEEGDAHELDSIDFSPPPPSPDFLSDTDTKYTSSHKRKRKAGSKKREKKSGEGRKEKKHRVKLSREERRAMEKKRKTEHLIYRRRKTKAPNPCWCCDLDFPTQEECFAHTMKEHFKPGNEICSRCSKISTTNVIRLFHERLCETFKPGELLDTWKCDRCDKEYPSKTDLSNHLANHPVEGLILSCNYPGCDFTTKFPNGLKGHTRNRHVRPGIKEPGERAGGPVEGRTCDVCNQVFKSRYVMHRHRVNQHTKEGLRKYKERARKILDREIEARRENLASKETVCSKCNLDFYTHMALVFHIKNMHEDDQRFVQVCEKCGTRFSRSDGLRRHMIEVHTDARSFCCHVCGKAFKTANVLRTHHRHTHTEDGRLEYNAKMRMWNQRRKVITQALAQVKTHGEGQQHQPASSSLSSQSHPQYSSSQLLADAQSTQREQSGSNNNNNNFGNVDDMWLRLSTLE